MKAILLVSHGSRAPETKSEIEKLLKRLRKQSPEFIWEAAFLEINSPDMIMGIQKCVERGASSIVIVVNFLNAGRHVSKDIPKHVKTAQKKYSRVKFFITHHLACHPALDQVYLDLIKQAKIHKRKRYGKTKRRK